MDPQRTKFLLKLTLIGFLISFVLIYYIELNYSPQLINIKQIKENSSIGDIVKFNAKIRKQRVYNNNTIFLTLNYNNSKINAIIFNFNPDNYKPNLYNNNQKSSKSRNFNNKEIYQFIGKITLYNKEKEIIIKRINTLK